MSVLVLVEEVLGATSCAAGGGYAEAVFRARQIEARFREDKDERLC